VRHTVSARDVKSFKRGFLEKKILKNYVIFQGAKKRPKHRFLSLDLLHVKRRLLSVADKRYKLANYVPFEPRPRLLNAIRLG